MVDGIRFFDPTKLPRVNQNINFPEKSEDIEEILDKYVIDVIKSTGNLREKHEKFLEDLKNKKLFPKLPELSGDLKNEKDSKIRGSIEKRLDYIFNLFNTLKDNGINPQDVGRLKKVVTQNVLQYLVEEARPDPTIHKIPPPPPDPLDPK